MTLAPHRWRVLVGLLPRLWLGLGLVATPAMGLAVMAISVAQAEDAFEVVGITVDQSAASAAEARERALAEGRRVGLRRLLERLVPADQQRRLPSLGDQRIAELVQSFEVVRERAIGTRYQAELNLRYEPQGVRALLAEAGIGEAGAPPPVAAAPAQPLVVLPVLQRDGQRLLWEETNDWRAAWAGLAPAAAPATILPLGDLADLAAVDAERAAGGDRTAAEAIATRYGASGTVVAEAEPATDSAGRPMVAVRAARAGEGADAGFRRAFTANPGESAEALLARAAASVRQGIEERWVRPSAPVAGLPGATRLTASVALSGLSDLLAVRQRLAEVQAVRRQTVLALSRGTALIEIEYQGAPEALQQALAARGLALAAANPGDGGWRLDLVGGGGSGGRAAP